VVNFSDWMLDIQQRMELTLGSYLEAPASDLAGLYEAMRYAVLGGGKRVRCLLAFAAGESSAASIDVLEVVAASIEMIHAYSLVHDDMPEMDNDVLRRGKPTCHVRYGQAMALLAGDALQARAFELLANLNLAVPERKLRMIKILSKAAGPAGMVGGQAIDFVNVGISLSFQQLERMHQLKTGALIHAAVMIGGLAGDLGQDREEILDAYGRQVGLLFQVVDDVLDAVASTELLGKTAGKDAEDHKPTYVTILGLDTARRFAVDLHKSAVLSVSSLGREGHNLVELADFILQRQF